MLPGKTHVSTLSFKNMNSAVLQVSSCSIFSLYLPNILKNVKCLARVIKKFKYWRVQLGKPPH